MLKSLFQWLIILLVAGGVWYFVSERNEEAVEPVGLEEEEAEDPEYTGTIVSADGSITVYYSVIYENRAASVDLQVYSNAPQADTPFVDVLLEPAELGITLGFAEPYLISDDGRFVYLKQIFQSEGCGINGVWQLDVATGEVRDLRKLIGYDMQRYVIDPTTNQMTAQYYRLIPDLEAQGPGCGKIEGSITMKIFDLVNDALISESIQ